MFRRRAAVWLAGLWMLLGSWSGDLPFLDSLERQAAGDAVPLYIFAGQSNAVGWKTNTSELTPALLAAQGNVLFYGPTSSTPSPAWGAFQPPDETGIPSGSGFGPEITAGRDLAAALGDPKVAMVKFAAGGTNLHTQWNPNIGGSLYAQMMTRVNQSVAALPGQQGATADPAGFFWMQGESDSDTLVHANAYQANLANLIRRVRSDLGRPDLPVVLGQINNAFNYTWLVRQAQATVAANLPYVRLATTDDLQRAPGDPIHFSTQGTVDMGVRFASVFQEALAEAAPASLIVNGSFETPTTGGYALYSSGSSAIPGWTVGGSDGVTLVKNTQFSGAPASDGVQWLSLETYGSLASPNNWGTISQTFATRPGQTYVVQFDRAALSTGDGAAFYLSYDVGGAATRLPISTKDSLNSSNIASLTMTPWVAKSFSFTATGTATTLRFTGEARVGGFYGGAVDNVRAYEALPNVLANGSFESGDVATWQTLAPGSTTLAGWTVLGAGVTLSDDATFGGAQARDGVQWLSLTTIGGSAGGVSQTFATQPGMDYLLTFDYTALSHGDTTGNNVIYELSYDVGAGPVPLTVNAQGTPILNFAPWTTETLRFTATGASTTLTFLSGPGSFSGFYGPVVDNVWISAVPEPSTISMVVALAAVAPWVYLRRRFSVWRSF